MCGECDGGKCGEECCEDAARERGAALQASLEEKMDQYGPPRWSTGQAVMSAYYGHGVGCVVGANLRHGRNVVMGHYCIIGANVTIGDDVTLGDFVIIGDNVTIGDGTHIEHHVLLKAGTVIGRRCYVDSYVKSSGDNLIGDGVTLRFNATIARGVTVGNGAFISPNVMTVFSTHDGEKRPGTVIGAGAHIGTNAVIGPAVEIAPGAAVGALAYVSRDLPDRAIYVGIPARKLRDLEAPDADPEVGG